MKVPTRQVVRLGEIKHMIGARLDFSSCRNTLVGYTDNDGAYLVKSYREILAYLDTDGVVYYADDLVYATEEERLRQVKEGFTLLAKREARASVA